MQILMFGWEFPPRISGGLGTACFGITQALTGLGHDVVFVMPGREDESPVDGDGPIGGAFEASAPWEGLTLRTLNFGLRPYEREEHFRSCSQPFNPRHFCSPRSDSPYGPDLISEARRYGKAAGALARDCAFDVIHAHDWMTVFAGMEAKAVSGRPLILHIHSLEFDRAGENINWDIYAIERRGMEAADGVIAVSHYTRRAIIARYGVDPAKVVVIHNAVLKNDLPPTRCLRKDPTRKVVLFLGRITFQKGPEYFIEAASMVLREWPDVSFIMAGDGDMMPRMVERVADLGIGGNFHFTGFLSGEEVGRAFADSDLYVMPSVSEPFGITPLEALCHDVPVIISRQSGVSEILRHALKVDFWNVADLADKIIAVLRRSALREDLLEGSHEDLKRVRWVRSAEEIVGVYRSHLSPHPARD